MQPVVAGSFSTSRSSALIELLGLALGAMMAILDVTVVNVAFKEIDASFAIGVAGITWVVDGYTLAFASLLLFGASLADRFGQRRAYTAGIALFSASSLVCGLASTGAMLIAARAMQGAGAALFTPSALSLLNRMYPDAAERARVTSQWIALVSVSAVAGPLVGGLAIHALGWRSIFLINVPLGALALMLVSSRVRLVDERGLAKLALPRHALLSVALASACFALIEGARKGWASTSVIASCLLAALALGWLARVERHSTAPIFPAVLAGSATFLPAWASFTLLALTFYAQLFGIGLFLQHAMGATPLAVGLQLCPVMGIIVPANLASGALSARIGAQRTVALGLCFAILGAVSLLGLRPDTAYGWLVFGMLIANLGNGIAAPALTVLVMQEGGQAHGNAASGMLNFGRQLGSLAGVALTGAIIQSTGEDWADAIPATFSLVIAVHLLALAISSWGARKGTPRGDMARQPEPTPAEESR